MHRLNKALPHSLPWPHLSRWTSFIPNIDTHTCKNVMSKRGRCARLKLALRPIEIGFGFDGFANRALLAVKKSKTEIESHT
jgi:hypothetical protein